MKPHLLDHLSQRYLTESQVWNSDGDAVVQFPLYNLSGQLLGYQQYRPFAETKQNPECPSEAKYFNYLPTNKVTAYGLESLNYDDPLLFVVEGVFDAVRFHNMGLNCLAVLSCDPKHLKEWLRLLPFYKVAVCDGGAAGLKLAKYGDLYFQCREGNDPASEGEFMLRAFRRVARLKLRKHLLKRQF